MRRNYFTENEIILCAYAALYDENEFGGINGIHQLTSRSPGSISMKIRNIIAKLDEEGIPRNQRLTALTGTARGSGGRTTNWEIVEPLAQKSQRDLQVQCRQIVAKVAPDAA